MWLELLKHICIITSLTTPPASNYALESAKICCETVCATWARVLGDYEKRVGCQVLLALNDIKFSENNYTFRLLPCDCEWIRVCGEWIVNISAEWMFSRLKLKFKIHDKSPWLNIQMTPISRARSELALLSSLSARHSNGERHNKETTN